MSKSRIGLEYILIAFGWGCLIYALSLAFGCGGSNTVEDTLEPDAQISGPEFRGIEVDDSIEPEHQVDALVYAKGRIEEETSLDLTGIYSIVYWTTTVCPGTTKTAVIYDGLVGGEDSGGPCFNGLSWGCDEIYVAWRGDIGHSSLIHEFGHCARRFSGLPGDPDHLDEEFWQLISKEINEEVKGFGW